MAPALLPALVSAPRAALGCLSPNPAICTRGEGMAWAPGASRPLPGDAPSGGHSQLCSVQGPFWCVPPPPQLCGPLTLALPQPPSIRLPPSSTWQADPGSFPRARRLWLTPRSADPYWFKGVGRPSGPHRAGQYPSFQAAPLGRRARRPWRGRGARQGRDPGHGSPVGRGRDGCCCLSPDRWQLG